MFTDRKPGQARKAVEEQLRRDRAESRADALVYGHLADAYAERAFLQRKTPWGKWLDLHRAEQSYQKFTEAADVLLGTTDILDKPHG
jgi:hypothetical protein